VSWYSTLRREHPCLARLIPFRRRAVEKTLKFEYDLSSVSIHPKYDRLVAGSLKDPWIRVHDYESGAQIGNSTLLLG